MEETYLNLYISKIISKTLDCNINNIDENSITIIIEYLDPIVIPLPQNYEIYYKELKENYDSYYEEQKENYDSDYKEQKTDYNYNSGIIEP